MMSKGAGHTFPNLNERINMKRQRYPAMMEITMKLDEDVLSSLRRSPNEFARDMRLAAAIHWYKRGEVSQEKAAQVAGLDRTDFLLALPREGEDAFVVDFANLDKELKRG
jgi:predicted HTH domain antitoxin